MRKGVQAFTVREYVGDKEQCRETYRRIAEIGYDSIQSSVPACLSASECKLLLDEFGLHNCSSGWSYDKLRAGGSAYAEAAANARLFDNTTVAVATMPEGFRDSADGVKKYAETLNVIAAGLKKEGCSLSYHHHALEFFSLGGGLSAMDILTGETDPENVRFCLDTHWLTAGGVNPVEWIRRMKGRVPIIHFKDYAIVGGAESIGEVRKTFAEVGEGNIRWEPIVEACRECGVDFVIVEQDICKGSPFDSLSTSFASLVRLGV